MLAACFSWDMLPSKLLQVLSLIHIIQIFAQRGHSNLSLKIAFLTVFHPLLTFAVLPSLITGKIIYGFGKHLMSDFPAESKLQELFGIVSLVPYAQHSR